LATEVASKTEGDPQDIDIDAVLDGDSSEDKEIAAMGVAQTIGTVTFLFLQQTPRFYFRLSLRSYLP
jgi:hypothetical protein